MYGFQVMKMPNAKSWKCEAVWQNLESEIKQVCLKYRDNAKKVGRDSAWGVLHIM